MNRKVKQAYDEAKFKYQATPADANQDKFRRRTKRARPEDIKVYINQVWRTSQGPKKDFIFYERKVVIPDLAGNEDTDTELIGRYEMPKFRNVYNNQSGDVESIALAGFETQYDIPYSKANMERILTEAEIEREDGDVVKVPVDASNTVFTLVSGTRKYGGFSAEDFINRSYDELVQLGVYGTTHTVQNVTVKQIRGADDSEQQKVRVQQFTEEQVIEYEEAARKQRELEEARRRGYEAFKKEQEEEAKKRQEAVDQQSNKRVVRAEVKASFEKEAPLPAEDTDNPISSQEQREEEGSVPSNRKKSAEREEINEEVVHVLTRPEDQNVDEDEEIRKGLEELEQSKNKNKKGSK